MFMMKSLLWLLTIAVDDDFDEYWLCQVSAYMAEQVSAHKQLAGGVEFVEVQSGCWYKYSGRKKYLSDMQGL